MAFVELTLIELFAYDKLESKYTNSIVILRLVRQEHWLKLSKTILII